MSPLNLVQLQCLDSVVREGSFRGAAAALSLSQPSVSMHVANLEQRLGVQLLKRSARGTSLTDAGKQMLPHLRSVLRAEEAARQQAISLRGEMEGRVRIGAVSGALSTVVPEAIHLTLDRYHTLTFEVFQMRGGGSARACARRHSRHRPDSGIHDCRVPRHARRAAH